MQLREPPNEDQQQRLAVEQIRRTGVAPTVYYRDGQSYSVDYPAYDPNGGALAPVVRYPGPHGATSQGDRTSPVQGEGQIKNGDASADSNEDWSRRVDQYLQKREEYHRENPEQRGPPAFDPPAPPAGQSFLSARGQDLLEAAKRGRDKMREWLSSDDAQRYAENLTREAAKGEPVKPVNIALRQWVSKQYWRYTQKAIDDMVYKQSPDEMSEWDRLWLLGPRDIAQHGFKAILEKRKTEADKVSQPLSEALKQFEKNAEAEP
jgi:hypothetical protein